MYTPETIPQNEVNIPKSPTAAHIIVDMLPLRGYQHDVILAENF